MAPRGVVLELLKSLPGPVTYHVFDGAPATTAIAPKELAAAAIAITNCSIIYALDGINAVREPIAGFVGNESLGTVALASLD